MTSPDTTTQPAFELGGDVTYEPRPSAPGQSTYAVDEAHAFAGDQVAYATLADLPDLAASPHWEDRIRAEVLRARATIVLPDQFPCIYETADSPRQVGLKYPKPYPWVVSPDTDMLTDLLPLYQELWDSYTSQWGDGSRRTFAVGRLDGLSPRGVYLPGTKLETVIYKTMQLHGMYGRAPEHLKSMHPQHASWTAAHAEQIAAMDR